MASTTTLQRWEAPRVGQRLPAYLALETPAGGDALAERLSALTPRLMRWTEQLWLLDLSICESYWDARAVAEGQEPQALLRSMLERLAQVADDELGTPVPLRAAMADHPWQALLLVTHMQERHLSGVVGSGPFGESLLREVSWTSWWSCAETLALHLTDHPCRRLNRFNPTQFRSQSAQMRRAMQRLGLQTPWQLRDIEAPALQRRFGAVARDMVQWAYSVNRRETSVVAGGLFGAGAASETLFESGFPWQSFVLTSLPSVIRHLETPVCEWSHMESLLREDFDRLAGLASWQSGEKVVSLEWQLVLVDLAHLIIPIRFRHPHSLHLEKGCQTTALLQALYSFEGSPLGVRRTDDGEMYKAVVGWNLVITERLTLMPRTLGLFGDQGGGEELALLDLENKLRVPLESYTLRADWLPEDSYALRDSLCGSALTHRDPPADDGASRRVFASVARTRPLYVYSTPQALESQRPRQGASSVWRFQERTMAKWWQSPEAQRDYYRLTDGNTKKDLWVFKSPAGSWRVHGVYA